MRPRLRYVLATLLLLLQGRPLVGVALCLGLSGADGDRMELGCPMPEARAPEAEPPAATAPVETTAAPGAWDIPVLQAMTTSHECALAQVCTLATTPVLPVRIAIAVLDAPQHSVQWPAEAAIGTDRGAPPLPPPNA